MRHSLRIVTDMFRRNLKQVCLAESKEPATGDVVLQDFRYNSWGELTEAVTYDGNGLTAEHVRKTDVSGHSKENRGYPIRRRAGGDKIHL